MTHGPHEPTDPAGTPGATPAWTSPQGQPPAARVPEILSPERRDAPSQVAVFTIRAPRRIFVAHTFFALNILWFVWMVAHGVSLTNPEIDDLLRFGADFGADIARGQWWRLLSAAFVHIGLIHIAANMWALWRLGPWAERLYGSAAFAILYLLSAIGCSVASLLHAPAIVSAGASGAVFGAAGGVFAFYLMHKREMPAHAFKSLVTSMGSFLALNLFIGFSIPNIDNAGHLGGLLVGMAAGWCLERDPRVEPRLNLKRVGAVSFLALMLCGVCAFVPRRVMNSPEGWMMRAEKAYDDRDWTEVERDTTEVLRLAPTSKDAGVRALMFRAQSLMAQGRGREALADSDRALGIDPDSRYARRARAMVEYELGEFERAKQDLTVLVDAYPARAALHFELGRVDLALQDWAAASRSFEAALKLDPHEDRTQSEDAIDAVKAAIGLWLARTELGLIEQADRELQQFVDGAKSSDADDAEFDLLRIALGKADDRAYARAVASSDGDWARLLRAERAYALRTHDAMSLEVPMTMLTEVKPIAHDKVVQALVDPFLKRTRDEFGRLNRR
jgi:rhomboid protease GluP